MEFTNGDFEAGSLTGWTPDTYNGTAAATAGSKHTGTYGCDITVTTEDEGDGSATISQTISTTFYSIQFDYKVAAVSAGTYAHPHLFVDVTVHDGDDVEQQLTVLVTHITATGDWATATITKEDCEAAFPEGYHWKETGYTDVIVGIQVIW